MLTHRGQTLSEIEKFDDPRSDDEGEEESEGKGKLGGEYYEGRNFNFGNAAVTFDTAHLQSSYFHRPSMYSPKLCTRVGILILATLL